MPIQLALQRLPNLDDFCRKSAAPVGESEDARCERAERMIRNAIQSYPYFSPGILQGIRVFAQGSYRNGTNITTDSDVDIAVCSTAVFFPDYSQTGGLNETNFANRNVSYSFWNFRAEVTNAIQSAFGTANVALGNKALRVAGNSGRIGADVVPVFEFRQYRSNGQYTSGVRFLSLNDSKAITNWPDEHYLFGIQKNIATSYRFKKVVRILKALRREMTGGVAQTPSFLIESLVWNAPDHLFDNTGIAPGGEIVMPQVVTRILNWLGSALNNQSFVVMMREVNTIKPLFSHEQGWSLAEAVNFVHQAGGKFGCWS